MPQATAAASEPSAFSIEVAPFQERRPRVLKQGDTFAVFGPRGDILAADRSPEGVYHRDTRYLSYLELRLAGAPLLLLSSNVQEDNVVLSVDLTNPDLVVADRAAVRAEMIHVNRRKYLWQNCCWERLLVRNFDMVGHELLLDLSFAADFADMFEVRGQKRPRRGRSSIERCSDSLVVLRYAGLDGVKRMTSLGFEPAPTRLDGTTASFALSLAPGEAMGVVLRIACDEETAGCGAVGRRFYSLLRTARRAMRTTSGRAASLDSSNSLFNELSRRSVADLYMLITDTEHGPYPFAGIPWFSTAFGRDGIITALLTLWVDPLIAKGVLNFLAATQATETAPERDAEPGKILHEMRDGEMARLGEVPFARYYGSVDATPLFVMLMGEYFRRTGDIETVRLLWPNVEAALRWCDTDGDPDGDGFVEYHRRDGSGLVNQGWKDSQDAIFHEDGRLADGPIALCEVQGYVYAAKQHAAALAQALGRPYTAAALARQAELLRQRFEAAFWCEELGTYALALDGSKTPCRVVASNAGHALLTGIAAPERARRVADTLLGTACFSGWGVRTVAVSAARYNPMSYHNGSVWPHDNALIALGLDRYGFKTAAARIFAGLLDAAGYMEPRRLPELFCGFAWRKLTAPTLYPVACIPQAWASAAVLALVQACLGLRFGAAEAEIRLDHPILPEFLDSLHVRGLQGGRGSVDLKLQRSGAEVAVTVTRRQGEVPIVVSR
ncbi:MAG TPA: amylo-alpha-1,6-glucosidase [Stellaceae bacterium]|nr:amylo-alpha-1,6-glucosidase [Stellaceae bacterium]